MPSPTALSPRLRDVALEWGDLQLETVGHADLSLGALARGLNKQVPSVHKAVGSHMGFLAALGAIQWSRANEHLDQARQDPLSLALADIAFAIDHPHRFRLMYDHQLWAAATAAGGESTPREQEALDTMTAGRDRNFLFFERALRTGAPDDMSRARLIAALLTGLSFEFVNEGLFPGITDPAARRAAQLEHAEELLRRVI